MKAIGKAPLASAIGVVTVAGAAHASTIPPMDIPQLYAGASIVVHADVIEQHSQWEDIDGNNLIFTYSTLRVNSTAKRPATSRLMTVRTVGGTVDGISQTLIGEADVGVGEEVVLFMENVQGWTQPGVLGFHNGKFAVSRDAQGAISLSRDLGQRPGDRPLADATVSAAAFLDTVQAVESGEITPDDHVHTPECGHTVIHVLTPARELQGRAAAAQAAPASVATLAFEFAAPTCPDVNADGAVDVMDLSVMVSNWGADAPAADLDSSGTIDMADLSSLMSGWGRPCR